MVTDGPGAVDPLVAAGPVRPANTLRPGVSPQRTLILDTPNPLMADLATGAVSAWENGPPVTTPLVSSAFDLSAFGRLQVQVLRDNRETARGSTLVSLHLGDASQIVSVSESPHGSLIIDDGESRAIGPIGEALPIVVVFTHAPTDDGHDITVSARNAETMTAIELSLGVSTLNNAILTIGGPTVTATTKRGRRRNGAVHVHVEAPSEPNEQVRRAVRRARRVAGTLRDRIS